MSPPTKELMKLNLGAENRSRRTSGAALDDGQHLHPYRPCRNIKADKEKSTEKIDGAVATIMGLDRAIHCGINTGASVYDERGILIYMSIIMYLLRLKMK